MADSINQIFDRRNSKRLHLRAVMGFDNVVNHRYLTERDRQAYSPARYVPCALSLLGVGAKFFLGYLKGLIAGIVLLVAFNFKLAFGAILLDSIACADQVDNCAVVPCPTDEHTQPDNTGVMHFGDLGEVNDVFPTRARLRLTTPPNGSP